MSEIFKLTPKQQAAFNRLKKAYKDCEKAGIYFYNNYGYLSAVDKSLIDDYADVSTERHPENEYLSETEMYHNGPQYCKIANEWTDDAHKWHLTPKGWKVYNSEKD